MRLGYRAAGGRFHNRTDAAHDVLLSTFGLPHVKECEVSISQAAQVIFGQLLNNLGLAYFQKGEWDKALEYYQQSLTAKERLGDAFGMAQTFNNLGMVYANKGEWDKAIEFYQNALQTMERLGDAQGMAQALNNLGMVYGDKGEWDKAIEYYQQS
ncbi:hypothetical protein DCC62_31720, partial [candidate division KSB1 bacterium]